MYEAFQLEMGQRARLHRMFIVFRPYSIVSASKIAFFLENFRFGALFFFASKFRFAQICAAFRLEMGQRARLYRMFIVFQINSIFSATEMVLS